MNIHKYIVPILLLAVSHVFFSCETLSVDEKVQHAPVIGSFTPKKAPVGAEVVITGEFLNNVTEAYIGDVAVEICEKVSDSRLSVRVGKDVTGGTIALVNETGRGESSENFECSFAVPEIFASLLQQSAEMGENILLSGENLNSASGVYFTAVGYEDGYEAEIISQADNELVVKVPYVETSLARITMTYFDGNAEVSTSAEDAPQITVVKYAPEFNEYEFTRTAVGRSITLTGKYLNNVERITVGEFDAVVYASSEQLVFTVPAGNFVDGETTVELKAYYFGGNESVVLDPEFVVYVPFVKYWENVQLVCQGRVETSTFISFFSPETGIAYANEKWKTDLDPVALKHTDQYSGTANTPKPGVVSDEEYYSVVPYFFFSAVSGNVLQINSPANSNGQLKNFYINASNPSGTASNDNRVPGGNTSLAGTPIIGFRYINPATTDPAEQKLLADVKNGLIEKIDEETFPIDVEAKTIAGISVSSMSGGIKSSSWCDHQTETLADDPGYDPEAVFLVAYYTNCGYSKDNPAQNILRLGILEVTNIDWAVYQASTPNYGNSKVTFNCYWQKYDYDYSKL